MSFSDKRVADLVNSKFVAAWTNRGPGFMNTEFWTENGIAERNYEAYPTKNICTFFLTPEGKVFYYVAGSYSPEMFLSILENATAVRTALFDEKMQPKEKGKADVARLHESKADTYEDLQAQAARQGGWKSLTAAMRPGNYRGKKHVHSESCGWSLKEGYEYLAALHREWAGLKELPAFEDIRYRYLYGNDFTEETADSSHITKPEASAEPRPIARKPRARRDDVQADKHVLELGTPKFGILGQ